MAITINNAETIPSVVMDKLHIVNFTLRIDKESPYKKHIDIVAIPYGIDVNGNKIFSDKTVNVSTKDFDADVMNYAITSGENATPEEAYTEYLTETASVSSDISNNLISVWRFMAMFEGAIGKIFDIENVVDFNTVE